MAVTHVFSSSIGRTERSRRAHNVASYVKEKNRLVGRTHIFPNRKAAVAPIWIPQISDLLVVDFQERRSNGEFRANAGGNLLEQVADGTRDHTVEAGWVVRLCRLPSHTIFCYTKACLILRIVYFMRYFTDSTPIIVYVFPEPVWP